MAYVFFQILFLISLLVPWFGVPDFSRAWPLTLCAAALSVTALVLFVWSLAHNHVRNIGVSPVPPENNQLIQTGPYRFIRHPMYLAALILGIAAVFFYAEPWRLALYLGLGIVLHFKANYEERLLLQRYPEYADYQKKSKRIIPFIL